MDMAPSDTEIAEADKKYAELAKLKSDGEKK
jgi:hypothetical protein